MEYYILIILCITSLVSGFIDAIVGGGGLIQTPITMILLPNTSVSSIIGSLKIPGFSGTSIATYHYLKKVKVYFKLFLLMGILASFSAYAGSLLLTKVSNDFMKPILFIILILLFLYTYFKKDFGQQNLETFNQKSFYPKAIGIAIIIGFYDGFIGPGTGSLLILAFISFLGYDFLKASAYAKLINLSTNIGSIILFSLKGKIIWKIALPMAICNATGAWLGARLAISRGNSFIRTLFLIVVGLALFRFGYDVFIK